uniref:CHAT domain-containing protein n=1 Tax=Bionectria ochroleuca TaxID=29856 RepID=A0A0B7JU05_BIOOC
MKSAAAYGPIVVINVSDYRRDALIIEKDKLHSIILPHLERQHLEHLGKITKYEAEMLEWLWEAIAEPVLGVLGFDKPPMDGQRPHIRWIPTGALCRIPIHAAGFHCDGSKNTVMDRVISSYSPSVKALIDGLERHNRTYQGHSRYKAVLFGSNQLRYAPKEIDEVEKICRAMTLEVARPQARQEEILSALDNCAVFHFAGHGLSDGSDPSKSSLILRDNEMLTVASLLKSNLRHQAPFLAYLSACGTGQTKQYRLFDEGIHLIGAYQISGFQNVVGTLWEVEDRSCVEVATRTYEWIKNRGMSRRSVAEGLHHAARKLRGDWIEEISQLRTLNEIDSIIRHDHDIEGAADGMRNRGAAASRDMEPLDNPVLNWIPYVHYC